MLVILICAQFLLCGWALALRQSLPSKAELPVDISFTEFVEMPKVDQSHMWNQMQSEVRLEFLSLNIRIFAVNLCNFCF